MDDWPEGVPSSAMSSGAAAEESMTKCNWDPRGESESRFGEDLMRARVESV
jgi:hypothetical protein